MASPSQVSHEPEGAKWFIPLENNPEVFTSLIHSLGGSSSLSFCDVYSLDEPSLLAHIPRPVLALVVLIPKNPWNKLRTKEGTRLARDGLTYAGSGDDEPVLWIRQTIGNACGLYALIHAVANGARNHIEPGSLLDKLVKETIPLGPEGRSAVLYHSEELERKHTAAAKTGDTVAPAAEDHVEHHFEAFTKGKDGHLWELEGITDGPVDRGLLREEDDMLSEAALEQGIKKFFRLADGQADFSIIALANKSD